MKKLILVFFAIVMVASFSNKVAAQTSVTKSATAQATIIAPITLSAGSALEFGSIIGDATGGWVKVDASSTRTWEVAAMNPGDQGNTPAASVFTVGGEGAYTFDITLPANGVVTIDDAGAGVAMPVSDFTSNGTSGAATLVSGAFELHVGATLEVGASQVAGSYSGTYDVTVAYN